MALADHRPAAVQLQRLREAMDASPQAQRLGALAPQTPVQRMKVKSANSKTNKKKYTDLTVGSRKTFEERYNLENPPGGFTLTADEVYVYDVLCEQDVEFADSAELLTEIRQLVTDWGGQKFFYETPQKTGTETKIKKRIDLATQAAATNIKIYSSRSAADVQNLFDWATDIPLPLTGFNGFVRTPPAVVGNNPAPVDAPFSGHFGDRAHTVKHYRQKRAQGVRLICIHLNAAGSKEVRAVRDDPDFIKGGGEGSSAGGFGLKSENNFVSVALGGAKATWDHMKGKVASVELVR